MTKLNFVQWYFRNFFSSCICITHPTEIRPHIFVVTEFWWFFAKAQFNSFPNLEDFWYLPKNFDSGWKTTFLSLFLLLRILQQLCQLYRFEKNSFFSEKILVYFQKKSCLVCLGNLTISSASCGKFAKIYNENIFAARTSDIFTHVGHYQLAKT